MRGTYLTLQPAYMTTILECIFPHPLYNIQMFFLYVLDLSLIFFVFSIESVFLNNLTNCCIQFFYNYDNYCLNCQFLFFFISSIREDWKPVLTINSVIYGLQFLFLVSGYNFVVVDVHNYHVIYRNQIPVIL